VSLIRGFRANSIVTFVMSLLLAMALILLVVTSYYRKVRLAQIEDTARLVLRQVVTPIQGIASESAGVEVQRALQRTFRAHRGFTKAKIYLLKKDGTIPIRNRWLAKQFLDLLRPEMIKATVEKHLVHKRFGSQWVFPGRIARFHFVCQPLTDTSVYKAAGLLVDLRPLRAEIVKLNNLMLTYFVVNLVVIALIGAHRLNRIYMRPIQRMVKRADDFREEDAFIFTARSGDDEINRLSKSLNLLLSRISEDKRQLRQTVAELEVANQNLKRAQKEVVRAETLASVGRLASGLAHEIGNPIGIVLGYIDLLSAAQISDDDRKDYLLRMESEVQRINAIIRQLLDLARPTDPETDLIQLHDILKDTVAMVRPQPMMKRIDIDTRLGAEHDSVLAAPEQLRQVFLNLLLNAADAISTAGKETGHICIRSRSVADENQDSGMVTDLIELLFEDDGPGISPEHQGQIFEPFFTTKEPGKGTGLGLSVSFMIIESLKGQLTAESMAAGGTRMCIRLPLYAGEATALSGKQGPT
jgi:signal transduction histidine kinase